MNLRASCLALTAAAAVASCVVYDESLLEPAENGTGGQGNGTGDGGASQEGGATGGTGNVAGNETGGTSGSGGGGAGGTSGMDGGGGSDPTCTPKTFPPIPDESEVPDTGEDITFTTVQYDIDFGDREESGLDVNTDFLSIGLDLDGLCTTTTQAKCRLPKWAEDGTPDGPNGIDNTMGYIIQRVRNLVSDFSSENYSAALQRGGISLAFRVSEWNGAANDDQVRVETFTTAPYDALRMDGSKPDWDGDDSWPIASDSFEANNGVPDPDRPKFADPGAYVTGNRLVASLLESTLRVSVALSGLQERVDLRMSLKNSILLCDIEEVAMGLGYQLSNCTLGGAWTTDDLLAQLDQFPDPARPGSGAPLCYDPNPRGSYETFKARICERTDMRDSIGGATSPCNALSLGVNFTTRPALFGPIYQVEPIADRCDDAVHPRRDSCNPADSEYTSVDAGVPDGGEAADAGVDASEAGSPPEAGLADASLD